MSPERDGVYRTPKATKTFRERIEGGDSPLVGGSRRRAPSSPMTEGETKSSPTRTDSFHIIHKVPPGDSPYVRAKHAQLIDKAPGKSVALFWSAINNNDRVDSALKDMAIVMKQLNRAEEAVEAIKSFRNLCSHEAQESLDNVLLDLYKRCGKVDEQIELLQNKLKVVEEELAFNGRKTKITKSQGKKLFVPLRSERARLLGNIGWAYMQKNDFHTAERNYRKALSIEYDKNKQCNLAICLMYTGKISEAKLMLKSIKPSPETTKDSAQDSYIKSFDRACEILSQIESHPLCPNTGREKISRASYFMRDEKATGTETDYIFSVGLIDEKSDQKNRSQSRSARIFSRCDTDGGDPAFLEEMENISSSLADMGLSSSAEKWRTRFQCRDQFDSVPSSTHKAERQRQIAPSSFISKYTKWHDENGVGEARYQETGGSPYILNRKISMKENWKRNPSNSLIKNQRWVDMVDDEDSVTNSIEGEKKEQVAEITENLAGSTHMWHPEALTTSKSRKTWADMVEEEDQFLSTTTWSNFPAGNRQDPSPKQSNSPNPVYRKQISCSGKRCAEEFADENLNTNIIHSPSGKVQSSAEYQKQSLEQVNLTPPHSTHSPSREVYQTPCFGSAGEVFWSPPSSFSKGSFQHKKNLDSSPFSWRFDRNPSSKRSLTFDRQQKHYPKDGLDAEDENVLQGMDDKPTKRRNRLRVFQEITLPDTPRG
ncbi:hypothetical protein H6P81_019826 [Aristolochia fimbriata]|uniref:Protein POLLENLESS 3 n=1 Tax=Aristolochia fimbriata TaxID=158543 RepID=A0AAV7DVZ4_ARIFI|nr:hypothetical protein H6P81_019826 [Aristolochia fimbriata]